MAVKIVLKKYSSTSTENVTHDEGLSLSVDSGDLFVWSSSRTRAPADVVAVYAGGSWLSAVVTQSS